MQIVQWRIRGIHFGIAGELVTNPKVVPSNFRAARKTTDGREFQQEQRTFYNVFGHPPAVRPRVAVQRRCHSCVYREFQGTTSFQTSFPVPRILTMLKPQGGFRGGTVKQLTYKRPCPEICKSYEIHCPLTELSIVLKYEFPVYGGRKWNVHDVWSLCSAHFRWDDCRVGCLELI